MYANIEGLVYRNWGLSPISVSLRGAKRRGNPIKRGLVPFFVFSKIKKV